MNFRLGEKYSNLPQTKHGCFCPKKRKIKVEYDELKVKLFGIDVVGIIIDFLFSNMFLNFKFCPVKAK